MMKISAIISIPRGIKKFFYKVHNKEEAGSLLEGSICLCFQRFFQLLLESMTLCGPRFLFFDGFLRRWEVFWQDH